jgi:hypothetical protein
MLPESRKSTRVPHRALLHLTWSVEGSHNSGAAYCLDLSSGGLAIQANQPLPIGSYVTLHSAEAELTLAGWVRHCSPNGQQYFIGIEYTKSTRDELFGFFEDEKAV